MKFTLMVQQRRNLLAKISREIKRKLARTFKLPPAAGATTTIPAEASPKAVSALMLTWCDSTINVPGTRQLLSKARARVPKDLTP